MFSLRNYSSKLEKSLHVIQSQFDHCILQSLIEMHVQSTVDFMTRGTNDSGCNSRFPLGPEALDALPELANHDLEAVYALIPNSQADTGSTVHPTRDLVILLYPYSNSRDCSH